MLFRSIITTQVPVDKIGEVIGPKGKMINQIQEDTGADVSIEDDGTVYIASEGGEAAAKAKEVIDQIANPHVPEAGETFNGKVVKITSFGAFVNLTPGTDGLLHISQIRNLANGERIDSVEDVLKEGDTVEVIVQGVDDRGKISLAIPGFEDQESAGGRDRGGRTDRRDRGGDRRERSGRGDRDRRDRRSRSSEREDRYEAPRRSRSDHDDRYYDDEDQEDRPRHRRQSRDRDYEDGGDWFEDEDRGSRRDRRRVSRDDDEDRGGRGRGERRGRGSRAERDDRSDRGGRHERRSSGRGGYRGRRENPRYAADEHYDEYRADREERSERPRRRVRRDFDPFDSED